MNDREFINAIDADGKPLHIAVTNGRITHIGPQRASTPARETIDLEGLLVLPGFVDGHIHLDKSFVGDRWRPHQPWPACASAWPWKNANWPVPHPSSSAPMR